MTWQCYRAVLRAEAPLHIGWHRLGFIERTRYYIPARSMWGALCAGMARVRFGEQGVPKMYRDAERFCGEHLRFTCFFPGPSADPKAECLWRPRYESDGLRYGQLTPAEFEAKLVYSQASTAIQPDFSAAERGALHETEYLVPEFADENPYQRFRLHFIGYLFATEEISQDQLATILQSLQIGAEGHRGWGRMTGVLKPYNGKIFDDFEVMPDARLTVRAADGSFLPGHLECTAKDKNLRGDTEALSGRSWSDASHAGDAKGPGQRPVHAALCWSPGTRVTAPATFDIGAEGVWTLT